MLIHDEIAERRHIGDLVRRQQHVLVLGAHAELQEPPKEVVPALLGCRRVVYGSIEQVHPMLVLLVEAPHPGPGAGRVDYDRHAVELVMSGMKDVPGHTSVVTDGCVGVQ